MTHVASRTCDMLVERGRSEPIQISAGSRAGNVSRIAARTIYNMGYYIGVHVGCGARRLYGAVHVDPS